MVLILAAFAFNPPDPRRSLRRESRDLHAFSLYISPSFSLFISLYLYIFIVMNDAISGYSDEAVALYLNFAGKEKEEREREIVGAVVHCIVCDCVLVCIGSRGDSAFTG